MYTYTTLSLFTSITRFTGRPYLPGATSPYQTNKTPAENITQSRQRRTLQCHPRRYEPHYHGTDTHLQSHREKKTGAKSLLTRKELINGGAIMNGDIKEHEKEERKERGGGRNPAGTELSTEKEVKRTGEWEKERERGRGIRRIAFRPCSIKGEITHLLRFFLRTTAPIDQTTGCTSQFSTWNIDTKNQFHLCSLPLLSSHQRPDPWIRPCFMSSRYPYTVRYTSIMNVDRVYDINILNRLI